MELKKLAEQFLVDESVTDTRLGGFIQDLLPFCVVRRNGVVDIKRSTLPARDLVKIVLVARFVASRLPEGATVAGDVTGEEVAEFTGIPKNQVAARLKDCVDEKFAERVEVNTYRVRMHKIDDFLTRLSAAKGKDS